MADLPATGSLPSILVLPSPFTKGLDSLRNTTDGALIHPLVPFEEALNTEWDCDAHALMYVVADIAEGGPQAAAFPSPRINKSCLPEILKEGCNVFLTMIGIDIDAPNHAPLTPESHAILEASLGAALTKDPRLQSFAAYYTTRGGMRFLYVLDEPIPVAECEPYILGMIKLFDQAGVKINEKECKDWTRLFRLPKALREGERLGQRSFDEITVQPNQRIALADIPPGYSTSGKSTSTISKLKGIEALTAPLQRKIPDDTIYADYCETLGAKGQAKASSIYLEAKRRLKGRVCYACIFEGDVLAHPGARTDTIQRIVGELCALLTAMPGATPEFAYALLLPAVSQLEEDEGSTLSWRQVTWKAICKYWPREVAVATQAAIIEEEAWKSVVFGLRQWDPAPELLSADAHIIREYIKRRGILSSRNCYFILKTDGTYETTPTERAHLIARIRELGMDRVLETYSLAGASKGVEDRSIQGMINANVASGFEIEGVVTEEGDGTLAEDGKSLRRCLFRRKPALTGEYNEDVDTWLRVFAGDQYEKLCAWIGLALAWDEGPICALSIKGPPGCGKKLLVQGLIECVDTEKASDTIEFSKFKSGILHSPWLIVNEGFPSASNMAMPPADTFRSFVGGDPIRVEEKYAVPVTVRNPLRVIFTTNNDDVIRTLAGGRDLTPFDRDAIAQRLFHVDVRSSAVDWLLKAGGLAYTRGWIKGDSGARSGYVVAKHFRYLYDVRPREGSKQRGSRFLMEGSNNERLIKAMTLRSGAAPSVFEVLTRLIEYAGTEGTAVIDPTNRSIWVTENMIEKYEQKEFPARQTNHHVIKNVLAAMRKPGSEPKQGVMGFGKGRTLAVWHELNGPLILEEAIERGLPCMKLQQVLGYTPTDIAKPTTPKQGAMK